MSNNKRFKVEINSLYPALRYSTFICCILYLLYALVLSPYFAKKYENQRRKLGDTSMINIENLTVSLTEDTKSENKSRHKRSPNVKRPDMVYILVFTSMSVPPFLGMATGSHVFEAKQCPFHKCHITNNMHYFKDITKFDAIVFGMPGLANLMDFDFPSKRSPNQKYIFASMFPAPKQPLCDPKFDTFFNLTWSYRVDSDMRRGIIIKNYINQIIAPAMNPKWIKYRDMMEFPNAIFTKKHKAAAWIAPHCNFNSTETKVALDLQKALRAHNLVLDIYGHCGTMACNHKCGEMIQNTYYFYLSFEDVEAPDYVTESLLQGVHHYAIPIVYGGADYSRFMPEHSYLNAKTMTIPELVVKMKDLMNNLTAYGEYYRWKSYYSFHKTGDTGEYSDYCQLCTLLTMDKKHIERNIVYNFTGWWNYPACPKDFTPSIPPVLEEGPLGDPFNKAFTA